MYVALILQKEMRAASQVEGKVGNFVGISRL
jgi:hypothetical protein